MCNDFLFQVKNEGDSEIVQVAKDICKKIYEFISEDYEKQATSLLLCSINKITAVRNLKLCHLIVDFK